MSEEVKGPKRATSANSATNAISFLVRNIIQGEIATADAVKVVKVDAGGAGSAAGYVDVVSLVCTTDAFNKTLAPTTQFSLPYSRIQGGIAALIIDPEVGDIGLAVYSKRDSSNLKQEQKDPVQPGSFRTFDQADGFYLGGYLNKKPEIYLELNQDKEATLHAPQKVTINTKEAIINADESCTVNSKFVEVNASLSRFNGSVEVRDNLSWGKKGSGLNNGRASIVHGLDVDEGIVSSGGLTNSGGSLSSNGVVLESHKHTGVERGGASTGGPEK